MMYSSRLDSTVSLNPNQKPSTNQFNVGIEMDPFFHNEYFGDKQAQSSHLLSPNPQDLHLEYTRLNSMLISIGFSSLPDIFVSDNNNISSTLSV